MSYRAGDKVCGCEVLALIGRGAHGVVLQVRRSAPASSPQPTASRSPLSGRTQGPASGSGLANGPATPSSSSAAPRVHALKVLPCDGLSFGFGITSVGARDQAAQEDGEREAAFAEARLLQRLRHPHIVVCEDVFWDQDRRAVLLLLEFMDGGDLQSLIDARRSGGGPFDAHFARRVLAAVGGALAHVHARGILHRDVKPGNVLLTRNSQRIKLADFGIAKILERSAAAANTVVGTPYYLSPEIVMGQPYGDSSDAWALGVVLYEVSALRRPFEASNQLALVRRICEEPAPPLAEAVERDVRSVVEGLLVKPVDDRMPLGEALRASEAIAALVVDEVDGGGRAATERRAHRAPPPEAPAEPESPSPAPASSSSDSVSSCSGDEDGGAAEGSHHEFDEGAESSWWAAGAASWCGSEAAAAAREALGGDVDDPEELVRALAALEKERDSAEADASSSSDVNPAAFEALENELRLRIAALRVDAAAIIDGLLAEEDGEGDGAAAAAEGDEHGEGGLGASTLCSSPMSSVRESVHTKFEQALEVATSLGVDTDQSEDRIAKKSRMLSLRVKWGGVARFCMLPVIVGFDSLVAEVSRRFGVANGASLPQLSWREAGETFSLTSQADWEECLQRRGLLAQPGRLELSVEGDCPPPLPAQPRPRYSAAELQSPSSLSRPELFTWRVTDRSQLWATKRGPGRTMRTGARSPPRTAGGAAVMTPAGEAPSDIDAALKALRRRAHEGATFHHMGSSSGFRPRSSAPLAVAHAPRAAPVPEPRCEPGAPPAAPAPERMGTAGKARGGRAVRGRTAERGAASSPQGQAPAQCAPAAAPARGLSLEVSGRSVPLQ